MASVWVDPHTEVACAWVLMAPTDPWIAQIQRVVDLV